MTDPRYDPRFQRGWDGEEPPAPPDQTAPVAAAAPTPTQADAAVPDPTPPPAAGDVVRTPARGPDADEPASGHASDSDSDSAGAPARNPYLLVLVGVGALLILGAAGMLWQLTRPISSSDPAAFVGPQVESQVAPWILLAGVLALIAAISVRAVRRR